MRLRTFQRLSNVSFVVMLLLSAAGAVFVHQVSPLRDPAFEPNSGNGGSLIPELREVDWLAGATILTALLALSFTVILLLRWYQHLMTTSLPHPPRGITRSTLQFLLCMSLGLLMFAGIWMVWLLYLLNQWLVD